MGSWIKSSFVAYSHGMKTKDEQFFENIDAVEENLEPVNQRLHAIKFITISGIILSLLSTLNSGFQVFSL